VYIVCRPRKSVVLPTHSVTKITMGKQYAESSRRYVIGPIILVGFGNVPVISATIVDIGWDVVDGSADTVDELISTSTAFVKLYISLFVISRELLLRCL